MALEILSISPSATLQDVGRRASVAYGISAGGAMDQPALWHAASLLRDAAPVAAIECAGQGGTFRFTSPTRVALTGAEVRAKLNDTPVRAQSAFSVQAGDTLSISALTHGNYAYVSVKGGFAVPHFLGSQSNVPTLDTGPKLAAGMVLEYSPCAFAPPNCFHTGSGTTKITHCKPSHDPFRVIPGPQTGFFSQDTINLFFTTLFEKGNRGDRMGIEMHSTDTFSANNQSNIVSDFTQAGDIQMTGAGQPYVLMRDCQTTGGYPRIGTVVSVDLHRLAQLPAGHDIRFTSVTIDQARQLESAHHKNLMQLRGMVGPMVRHPKDIPNLLSYQLISGVISATDAKDDE